MFFIGRIPAFLIFCCFYVEEINLSYIQYEEELKQIMVEYEIAVGAEGGTAEDALTDYENKLRDAFEVHRSASAGNKENTIGKLIEIADEYAQIGMAFRKAEERTPDPIAESDMSEQTEDSAAESDTVPAESSETEEITENNIEEA